MVILKITLQNFSLLIAIGLILSGCGIMRTDHVAHDLKPMVVDHELPGTELLDVSIAVFDSEKLTPDELEKQGLSDKIRQAEQRFIPIHLKYTLQRTGYWGAVRVLPDDNEANVQVSGILLQSDGQRLDVRVEVKDSRGEIWFVKTYTETVTPGDYADVVVEKKDAFQDIYTAIANDMAAYRNRLTPARVRDIRQISELRFAADMAPDKFTGYLAEDRKKNFTLVRLPDKSDPMLKRVKAVKVRDEMLADVINGYYDMLYQDLWKPYADWRKLHSEEVIALRAVEKEALNRQLFGVAAIIGAILVSSSNDDLADSVLPGVMVMGGAAAFYSGLQKREETRIHKDAIEELGDSFSAEAEPLVVEVEGEMVRLSGSAEEQYTKWREMLREIYAAETGLPPVEKADGKTR